MRKLWRISHLKKQKFVDEYLIDVNAAQAAIRAGYSEKTANVYSANNKKLICVELQQELTEAFNDDLADTVNIFICSKVTYSGKYNPVTKMSKP